MSMDDFDDLGPSADFGEGGTKQPKRGIDVPLSKEKRTVNGVEFPVEMQFDSRHSPGDVYMTTVFDENGFVSCTCVGFSYRQRCWHAKEAREKVKEMMGNAVGNS